MFSNIKAFTHQNANANLYTKEAYFVLTTLAAQRISRFIDATYSSYPFAKEYFYMYIHNICKL